MNKLSVFCFIFLLMLGGPAWTESELGEQFGTKINISAHQPIDFCFLISRLNTHEELLFGTCKISSADDVQWDLLPFGTPADDPDNIPVDLYFFQDPKAYNVFFTENGYEAEWNLFVKTECTLKFTLLGGAVPGEGGSLELFNDDVELFDIVDNAVRTLVAGQYTIKYVPAPDKPAEVEYTFRPGWNLLHFPIVVKGENTEWETLNRLPRLTLSGRTYVQGGEIRCGEAFWVFYKDGDITDNTLTVSGYEPTYWPVPQSGWNFTGVKDDDATATADAYEWADGQYQTPKTLLDSSKGYWIPAKNLQ